MIHTIEVEALCSVMGFPRTQEWKGLTTAVSTAITVCALFPDKEGAELSEAVDRHMPLETTPFVHGLAVGIALMLRAQEKDA